MRRLPIAILAGAAVTLAAGTALAETAKTHTMSVALPDGSIPQDHIFAGGPNLSWEADIAWVIRGGADPFAYIEKYGKRITAVHVKDIAPAGENADQDGWADVGHGTVEWAKLFKALSATPAKYYIVEHDNPKDYKATAERSIASIKTY